MNIAASQPTRLTSPLLQAASPAAPPVASRSADSVELRGSSRDSAAAARGADAPSPAWSPLAKGAAIATGIVGGALVSGAVAAACGFGGLQLGGVIARALFTQEASFVGAVTQMFNISSRALLAAPVLGAVGGGIAGAAAARAIEPKVPSTVPGSDRVQQAAAPGVASVGQVFAAPFQQTGHAVHQQVARASEATSTLEAARAGASAASTFASRVGAFGGGLMGAVQGACLGGMMAGLPVAFAPLTAIPAAIIGAYGMSQVTSKLGSLVGGAVGAPLGAAAGALGHQLGKHLAP